MREIKLFVLVIFGLSITFLNLQADYLDVGDDPSKIEIVTTQEISVPSGYKFKGWSPDGEYFAIARLDRSYDRLPGEETKELLYKTIIFKKNGEEFRRFDGAAHLWSPDSKSLVIVKGANNYWMKNIITGQNERMEIDIVDVIAKNQDEYIRCFNPDTSTVLFYWRNKIFEYNITTKQNKLIYTVNKGHLDDLFRFSEDILYYSARGDGKKHIYKYSFKNKKLNQISPLSVAEFNFKRLKSSIIFYSDGRSDEYSYFIDENGTILLKIMGFVFENVEGKSNEYVNMEFTSIAPNGKLFASTIGEFTEIVDKVISGDIYVFNFSGKMIPLIKSDDKVELVMGWSPQGDKLIFKENNTKKFYLLQLNRKK